jgi:photosystem II stability/assembly factor-like uncharacterized protein
MLQVSGLGILDAHLVAHEVGWVRIGSYLKFTTDNGVTWRDVAPPHKANEVISGVDFSDQNHGFVTFIASRDASVADIGEEHNDVRVAHTVDGGKTWTSTRIANSQIPNGWACCGSATVVFADARHGWLMTRQWSSVAWSIGELFSSDDGGKTWAPLPDPPSAALPVFVTSTIGWAVKEPIGDTLMKTTDGGKTWKPVPIVDDAMCSLNERCRAGYDLPRFSNPMHGRVIVTLFRAEGNAALLEYVTSDGGRTWDKGETYTEKDQEITAGQLRAMETADGKGMIMIRTHVDLDHGGSSLTITGIDGQKTASFAPVAAHSDTAFGFIGFINKSEGWVVKVDRVGLGFRQIRNIAALLVTEDGGATYTPIAAPTICPECAATSGATAPD